jgi:hypothetical protein
LHTSTRALCPVTDSKALRWRKNAPAHSHLSPAYSERNLGVTAAGVSRRSALLHECLCVARYLWLFTESPSASYRGRTDTCFTRMPSPSHSQTPHTSGSAATASFISQLRVHSEPCLASQQLRGHQSCGSWTTAGYEFECATVGLTCACCSSAAHARGKISVTTLTLKACLHVTETWQQLNVSVWYGWHLHGYKASSNCGPVCAAVCKVPRSH